MIPGTLGFKPDVSGLALHRRPHRASALQVYAVSTGAGTPTKRLKEPQGNWQRLLPLIGETPAYLADHYKFVAERVEQHGSVFASSIFGLPCVFLTSFRARDQVADGLHKTTRTFQPPSFTKLMGNDPQGGVAATYQRDTHVAMRKRVGAALSAEAVAYNLPLVEAIARKHLAFWQAAGAFDLETKMRELVITFSHEVVVGLGLSEQQKADLAHHSKLFTKNLYSIPVDLGPAFRTPYRLALESKQKMEDIILPNVQQAIADLEAGKWGSLGKRRTTLQSYMFLTKQEGQELSPAGVTDLAMNLTVAGFDTTAWSFLSLLVMLPQLPKRCIQRLREEQQQVVQQHGETLSSAALSASRYADALVHEVLRLHGPVPISLKQAIADMVIDDTHIASGTILAISTIYSRAVDQKVSQGTPLVGTVLPQHMSLEDLEQSFRPERWLSQDTVPTSDGQFGAGMHFCLGYPLFMAEAKSFLAIYARQYDMTFDTQPAWQNCTPPATKEPVVARVSAYTPP